MKNPNQHFLIDTSQETKRLAPRVINGGFSVWWFLVMALATFNICAFFVLSAIVIVVNKNRGINVEKCWVSKRPKSVRYGEKARRPKLKQTNKQTKKTWRLKLTQSRGCSVKLILCTAILPCYLIIAQKGNIFFVQVEQIIYKRQRTLG